MSNRGQPVFQIGRTIKARALNRVAKGASYATQRLPGPRQIDQGDDGPQESATPVSGGGEPELFTIVSEQADTITASDGTVIAKPVPLRGDVSPRTFGTQIHRIAPQFVDAAPIATIEVLSTIYAFPMANTGVAGATHIMMGDGRMWVRTGNV